MIIRKFITSKRLANWQENESRTDERIEYRNTLPNNLLLNWYSSAKTIRLVEFAEMKKLNASLLDHWSWRSWLEKWTTTTKTRMNWTKITSPTEPNRTKFASSSRGKKVGEETDTEVPPAEVQKQGKQQSNCVWTHCAANRSIYRGNFFFRPLVEARGVCSKYTVWIFQRSTHTITKLSK